MQVLSVMDGTDGVLDFSISDLLADAPYPNV